MYFIPDEIIIIISLLLPIENNNKLSQTNSRFNNLIFNSEIFWRRKFLLDYGSSEQDISSWKTAYYNNYGQIIVFGYPVYPNGPGFHGNYKQMTQISKIRARKIYCNNSCIIIIDLEGNIKYFESVGIERTQYKFIQDSSFNLPAKDCSGECNNKVIIDINNDVWLYGYIELGKRSTCIKSIRTTIKIPDIKAQTISSGYLHTVILDINNNVWSFGNNDCGQLGLGDTNYRYEPTQIVGIRAKYITCGQYSTFIIDIDNNVLGFGRNFGYALGLGDTQNRSSPIFIPNIQGKSVSCSISHTMIIDLNNNLWGAGNNCDGELGLGNKECKRFFTQIPNIKARSVSCGGFYTMIIDMNDNVWGFGDNLNGQLGLGDRIQCLTPTQIPDIKARSLSCSKIHSVVRF